MLSFIFFTPTEVSIKIAQRAQAKRLALNLTQQSLADRSGVSLGTLKKFERTGHISLGALLKLAMALGALQEFAALFAPTDPTSLPSMDVLLKQKIRKRGRR